MVILVPHYTIDTVSLFSSKLQQYNHSQQSYKTTITDELVMRERARARMRKVVTSQIVSNSSIYLPAVVELLSYKQ